MTYYCRRCERSFGSESALNQHVADSPSHHVCSECYKDLSSAHGLHDHCRQKHPYCLDCREVFESDRALWVHRRSSIHRPDQLICPGMHCEREFESDSSLVAHLEAGTCRSGADKAWVNRMAVLMDVTRSFNVPGGPVSGLGCARAPDSGMVVLEYLKYNGLSYESILWKKTLANQYLFDALPVLLGNGYCVQAYTCPSSRRFNGCGMEFHSASALFQHVEGWGCGLDVDEFGNIMTRFIEFLHKTAN